MGKGITRIVGSGGERHVLEWSGPSEPMEALVDALNKTGYWRAEVQVQNTQDCPPYPLATMVASARRIRELRAGRGLSVATAADLCGVDEQMWNQIEAGTVPVRECDVEAICLVLGEAGKTP